jgi:hypothetical protein
MAESFGILLRLVLDFYFEKKIRTHSTSIVVELQLLCSCLSREATIKRSKRFDPGSSPVIKRTTTLV